MHRKKLAAYAVGITLFAMPLVASADVFEDINAQVQSVIAALQNYLASGSLAPALQGSVAGATTSAEGQEDVALKSAEADVRIFTSLLQSSPQGTASPAGGAATQAAQVQAAKKRAEHMQKLAALDAAAFLRNAMPAGMRAQLSAGVQNEIEKKVSVTGTIEVLHIDDFSNEHNSEFEYHLRVGVTRYALYVTDGMSAVSSGSQVQVRGYQLGETLVAQGGTGGVAVIQGAAPDAVGTQKILVILVKSPGAQTPTSAQMRDTIFSGNFQKYYDEQSYGKVRFEGDVTEWIPHNGLGTSACFAAELGSVQVKQYILDHAIDLATYDDIVIVVDGTYGGCAFLGKVDWLFNGVIYHISLSWDGWPNSGYDYVGAMTGFEYVLSHEVGHQLGVLHANGWSCEGPSLDQNCAHQEYGNWYDVMGTGSYTTHFNAFYKYFLGWLSPSDIVHITSSGTYSIVPLEKQTGVRAAVIDHPALNALYTPHQPLYIEFRQPLGFDFRLPISGRGLHLNKVIQPPGWIPAPRLINTNYATHPGPIWMAEPILLPGSTFTWNSHGVSIGSLSASPDLATFSVTLSDPSCVAKDFSTSPWDERLSTSPGGSAYSQMKLLNRDLFGCGPSSFTMTASLPEGSLWQINQVYPEGEFSVIPGEVAYMATVVNSPANAQPGDQETITIKIKSGAKEQVIQKTFSIIAPPVITSIAPTIGSAGDSVTLTGTGFGDKYNNQVYIYAFFDGIYHYQKIENLLATGGTITFAFPSQIIKDDPVQGTSFVAPPPGTYSVWLIRMTDFAGSNTVPFEILKTEAKIDVKLNDSDGPIEAKVADSVRVAWISSGVSACQLDQTGPVPASLPFVPTSFSGMGPPLTNEYVGSTVLTITCRAPSGNTVADSVTLNVASPPSSIDIKFNGSDDPVTVPAGSRLQIDWTLQNAHSCTLVQNGPQPLTMPVTASLSVLTAPLSDALIGTTTQTITCAASSGDKISDSAVLVVIPTSGSVDIKFNGTDDPVTLKVGDPQLNVIWTSQNVSSCVLDQTGPMPLSHVSVATTYSGLGAPMTSAWIGTTVTTITCTTSSGSTVSDSATLIVQASTALFTPRLQLASALTALNSALQAILQLLGR